MPFPRIGATGLNLGIQGAVTNAITLQAGETYLIPGGVYHVAPGPYTSVQFLDPLSLMWRTINAENSLAPAHIDSDGTNFRLANATGVPIGALITNSGAGYTNGVGTAATGLTVTSSAGGSVWVPVVGGAINSTVTVTAGGSGYTFPPTILFSPPAAGGIQASGFTTLTSGAVSGVTVTNQGAGYVSAPTITVVNDWRDTTGAGAVLTANATLVNSGGLTALYTNQTQGTAGWGTAVTALPTFTFAPASTTAATMLMNWVVTTYAVTTAGAAIGTTALGFAINAAQPFTNNRAANVAGPINDIALSQSRPALIQFNVSAGAIAAPTLGTNALILDNGYGFMAVPNINIVPQSLPTTWPAATATVGGITDTSFLMPI